MAQVVAPAALISRTDFHPHRHKQQWAWRLSLGDAQKHLARPGGGGSGPPRGLQAPCPAQPSYRTPSPPSRACKDVPHPAHHQESPVLRTDSSRDGEAGPGPCLVPFDSWDHEGVGRRPCRDCGAEPVRGARAVVGRGPHGPHCPRGQGQRTPRRPPPGLKSLPWLHRQAGKTGLQAEGHRLL